MSFNYKVSIPFGSIIRSRRWKEQVVANEFQFLLVRLLAENLIEILTAYKVSIPFGSIIRDRINRDEIYSSTFQFLLVRLLAKQSVIT